MNITTILLACILFPALLPAQDAETKPVFDPNPAGLDKFGKLLEKDPFDFDKPPAAVEQPPPPMEGWMLAGITKTDEYQTAILVNMKTSERLRLNHYKNPPTKRANTTLFGGAKYELVDIEFSDNDPHLKNASAIISKDGERTKVDYSDEIMKLKPAANPAGTKGPVVPGAMPPGTIRPAQPGQPGAQPAAGGNSNAELIKMLQKQRGEHPGAAGGNPAGAPGAGGTAPAPPSAAAPGTPPQPRRRVVLPTEAAGATPAPTAPTGSPPPAPSPEPQPANTPGV